MVQILDALVPQTVELLPDVLRFFDRLTTVPEQVIEVPKILLEDVPLRAVLRDPQLAEQLVEVPTIETYSWLQLRTEQTVDIPDSGRGGRISGLQGFLLDRVQQRCLLLMNVFVSGLWSRSLLFPVEAFKIFAQDRVHPLLRTFQLVFLKVWMSLVQVFFRTFPQNKKVRRRILPESEGARQCQPIHAGSSAPCSSQGVGHGLE